MIRRPLPEHRARLALALRDDPKITAAASTTLKWTVPPPRRRVDPFTAANFRGPAEAVPFSVGAPSTRLAGREASVPRSSSCPSTSSSSNRSSSPRALERVAREPTASRRRRLWAGLSKDPVPRRGFPHPLRSVFAVFHDLDGLLLSEPSDIFQSVTLVELVSRKAVPDGGLSKIAGPKTHAPRESPRGAPSDTRPRTAEAILSPTCSWRTRACLDVSLQGFDPPNRPDPLTPIAVASDSTGAAIPGLGGAIRSEPRFATGHTIPPGNGCRLAHTEI